MPLARYFAFAGSLLLALFILADWYFPKLAAAPARAEVDRTIIRLHSAHKWPEATVFDTSLPTIVPPPSLAVAERLPPPAIARSPKQAFALALPEVTPVRADVAAVARKQIQRRRARAPAASARRIASYETGDFRTVLPAGW
ncbi:MULTISPECIES: hypothetical protein [Bradyrhizobium]|uniref:Uncharacterized protein n=2 Tax=Bradyrhizobium TaxID=374 RepID=A0ABY0PLK2_9BRAD|nr:MULTISPECIES: hypothetical protein [Bradyrhizobium]SDI51076.1 hypothetical protein SAMN05444163_3008 [Bradyrhizobium ottawaense]SED45846.1 hypothetical protein SAMN05444171_4161 [Bradyrhizobium lablabi]SHL44731.1 hypothetical protein SAMN05444321_2934 [Bradyrhizobium lablabi]